MRRTARRLVALLRVAGLAVAVSGCEFMPDPEFAALERALTLRIVEARRGASGGSADFSLELANRGMAAAFSFAATVQSCSTLCARKPNRALEPTAQVTRDASRGSVPRR